MSRVPPHRPNELKPIYLTTTAFNSWPGAISSPRLQMFNGHQTQALQVVGCTEPATYAGMEFKYGDYTFGVVMPHDGRILKTIHRYHRTVGDDAIKESPEMIAIYEYEKELPDGRTVMEVDYFTCPTHHSLHQHFGYRLNYITPLQEYMAKDTVIARSPSISPEGTYRYGIEAEVAMMSIRQVIEDGVVVCDSFCDAATSLGIETYTLSWGKTKYPLNYYGDFDLYKIVPDIGECVGDDGILAVLRSYDERTAPVMMSRGALRRPDFKYDDVIYVPKGARVIDVKVYHDTRVDGVIRGKSPNTPTGMSRQAAKYLTAERAFYQNVLNFYDDLMRNRAKTSMQISPRLHNLVVRGMASIRKGDAQRIHSTFRGAPIDEWRMEVTVEYAVRPTIGSKITGLDGDKGVIADIWRDEDMPVDAAGNRAWVIMEGLSTVKRMNVSRLLRQYINAASRDLTKQLKARAAAGESYDSLSATLVRYYEITSPRTLEIVCENGKIKKQHMDYVLKDRIRNWIPTDNEPEQLDIIEQLHAEFPPVYGPVRYRGASGNFRETVYPILIGSLYIMTLEKTGKTAAAVASAKLNHFGIPAKLTTTDRNASPIRNQPIRFGESEWRLLVAMLGGRPVAELADRTNNPEVRKHVQEALLRSEKPTAEREIVPRDQFMLGKGRISSLINHFGECAGWRFARTQKHD